MTQTPPSLSHFLAQQHDWIDGLLLAHQEALVEKRLHAAKVLYACFHRALKQHALAEDQLLLELHRQQCPSPKWSTSIYMHEHRKIYDLLDKLGIRVDQLESIHTRDVIELLDQQKTLKGVIEHHGEREEKGMMAELEQRLTAQQQDQLKSQLTAFWQDTNQQIKQTVAGMSAGLL